MSIAKTDTVQNWRDIGLGGVDLPDAIRDVLLENGFETLGDISRRTQAGAKMGLIRGLRGMVPDAANEIEAILNSHRAAESDDAGGTADDTADATDAAMASMVPPEVLATSMGTLLAEVEMLRAHDDVARAFAEQAERLEARWVNLKEQTAAAKKSLDAKLTELREHVQSREPAAPLFDGVKDAAPAEARGAVAMLDGKKYRVSETPADPSAEAWRDTTLEELGITGKLAELLARHDPPLRTLGAIADHCEGNALTDIAGIGEAKATQIEAAMSNWWSDHLNADDSAPKDADDTPIKGVLDVGMNDPDGEAEREAHAFTLPA